MVLKVNQEQTVHLDLKAKRVIKVQLASLERKATLEVRVLKALNANAVIRVKKEVLVHKGHEVILDQLDQKGKRAVTQEMC